MKINKRGVGVILVILSLLVLLVVSGCAREQQVSESKVTYTTGELQPGAEPPELTENIEGLDEDEYEAPQANFLVRILNQMREKLKAESSE